MILTCPIIKKAFKHHTAPKRLRLQTKKSFPAALRRQKGLPYPVF